MRLALLAMLVIVLAGCGGSTSAPTTTAPSGSPQTRALVRYLDAVRGRYVRFGVLSQQVTAALRGVNPSRPDASWDRAARQLAKAATAFRKLASSLVVMKVPRPLQAAHFRLAEGVGLFAEYIDGVRAALQVGIPSALGTASAGDLGRALSARGEWGAAVSGYAGRLQMVVPGWVSPGPAA